MKRLPLLLFAAALATLPARAGLPDGLYTTQAPVKGAPTPVGFNSSSRSGFTLQIDGKAWRLAQPILPLDFTWLKPWIEGPGVIVRVRSVAGSNPSDAAERLSRNWFSPLGSTPFRTDSGLQGVRVLFGAAGKVGAGVAVAKAAYLLPNRQGFVYAFVAEPWPRGADLFRAPKIDSPLPTDALMQSAGWEKERVGYRP